MINTTNVPKLNFDTELHEKGANPGPACAELDYPYIYTTLVFKEKLRRAIDFNIRWLTAWQLTDDVLVWPVCH